MDAIDKAITTLNASSSAARGVTLDVDARCQAVVTVAYLCFMLSVPLERLEQLVWYAVYPIVWSAITGMGYGRVFRRSLIVLPFIAFIGIFNPLVDHTPWLQVGAITVSRGWVTFVSIIVRGLLSVQAVVLLVTVVGFVPLCRALGSLGLPAFMETQLMLVYRYLIVLLQELQTMRRAREARGMGRRPTLRVWATMMGQLFVRTVGRAERIQRAMLARGFTGRLQFMRPPRRLTSRDLAIAAAWIATFALLRFVYIPSLLHFQ